LHAAAAAAASAAVGPAVAADGDVSTTEPLCDALTPSGDVVNLPSLPPTDKQ